MKKIISLTIFLVILLLVLVGGSRGYAQRVIVTRSTVLLPVAGNNTTMYTNGYWKWSRRYQKHIWVAHSRARFRVQRGYRVRI